MILGSPRGVPFRRRGCAFPAADRTRAILTPMPLPVTILYGNLCAIPQRNLKRLMGYSSIAHAGYLLLGVAASSPDAECPNSLSISK